MSLPHFVVLIDGECPMCRRTARRLTRLDWLHRLTFEDATNPAVRTRVAPDLDEDTALAAMHVVGADGSRRSGFDGFVRIASVVPALWIGGLLGALPGIRHLGRLVYAFVAAHRTRTRCTDAVCMPPR